MNKFLLGGIPIRYSRVRKFSRKGRHLIILIKVLAAWYLVIGISALLIGNTNAFFMDTEKLSTDMKAGIWQSSLVITSASGAGSSLSATVTNVGADMKTPGYYEVYYSNPEDSGETVSVMMGNIPALMMNESTQLQYEAQENGVYQFKVYLEGEEGNAKWSGHFEVDAFEESEKPAEETEEEAPGENGETPPGETPGETENPEVPEEEQDDQTGETEEPAQPEPADPIEPEPPADSKDESSEPDSPEGNSNGEQGEPVVTEPQDPVTTEPQNNQETQEGE